MARVRRYSHAIAAAALIVALFTMSAPAQYLFDRPVLAVDPEMHTGNIWSLAVDRGGQFVVTAGGDGTIRVWRSLDGALLKTIRIPASPMGALYAVAISPDGSTIAAAGLTFVTSGYNSIFLFDRESGGLVTRIQRVHHTVNSLAFSTDGDCLLWH
jgi:WD40 repeat protein